ncbi:legume-like lectin family-domain-containing protein [Phycomyces blakesleeanus]|uniref:Legume-like lectin family-domain-containing protein n=1 Tax=Phycomyces blakesleeanus TaxID=4837 RepID=A0ABR3AYV5_PHYBL
MPYIDDELQSRWFDFGGDTIINTNRQIRLTSTKPSQSGYLWSRLPLTATDFEIEFKFKVAGSSSHLFGDGFAMWLTKQRAVTGPVFGSVDFFNGLGIFFDSYDNERAHRHSFPYVRSMLNDGSKSYDNSQDGRMTELAGCEANFRDREFPTRGKLTYHKNNYVQLELMWREEDVWEVCFKQHKVELPDQVYLGFTAHTGEVTDNHDIISVTTRTLPPKPIESLPEVPVTKPKKNYGGVWSFLFKLVAICGAIGVLFVGYRFYENKNRMKRF